MMQAILGSQVLFLAVFLHMIFRPFAEEILDNVETYSLASSVVTLLCGVLLLSETTPDAWKIIATILIFFSITAFVIYVIAQLIYAVRHQKELLDLRQSRKDQTSTNNLSVVAMKDNPMKKVTSVEAAKIYLRVSTLKAK